MTGQPAAPKVRRKLTRKQIQEILERNLKLYRDEDSFITYLVDLALYLVEFEYNWEESNSPPPQLAPSPEELAPVAGKVTKGNAKIYHLINETPVDKDSGRQCPHCGAPIGDDLICPNCRNLTQ